MKVTMYTKDESCASIGTVNVAHVTMFENNILTLHFTEPDEQIKFIKVCIRMYVKFECQGNSVKLIPEVNNFQRVRFRFDS